MPVIYTEEWIAAMFKLVNSQSNISAQLPGGEWCVALEVVGDGISPYVPRGETLNFFVRLQDGNMVECRGQVRGIWLFRRLIHRASWFRTFHR